MGPSKLTFVASGLRCGGIQRAVVLLANGLLARGHRVAVLTFAHAETDFFRLPDAAVRSSLNMRAGGDPTPLLKLLPSTVARLKALRAAIETTQPDVVISHAPHINVQTLLAMRGSRVPVIVTEHGDVPVRQGRDLWLWKKWLWYRLRRASYPSAHKVVSVSAAIDRSFAWLPEDRRSVIHNPFPSLDRQPLPAPLPQGLALDRPWIASMGRLSFAKGFDVLLTAFERIAPRFPEWRLVIIGDGPLRTQLQRQAGGLIASGQIVFTGALADPFALLQEAKFFAMASRYEGFPMAHGEALACGLPVIATDCPSRPLRQEERGAVAGGVRELVRNGVDGILVPPEDPAALAAAMAELIENPKRRQRFAQEAAAGMSRFSCEKVIDDWERLVAEAWEAKRELGRS